MFMCIPLLLHTLTLLLQKYNLGLHLNSSEYTPTWGSTSFTLQIGDASLNVPVNVGFLAGGWNFMYHFDGSISLPAPAMISNTKYNVSYPISQCTTSFTYL